MLIFRLMLGCTGEPPVQQQPTFVDNDGDGISSEDGDCNDLNIAVSPYASEICDGIDNDCDGLIDDEDLNLSVATATTYYADADRDGFGSAGSPLARCRQPIGYVLNQEDCDDLNAEVNPSATEICDSIDNNCNMLIDDDDPEIPVNEGQQFFLDSDSDGYGTPYQTTKACSQPAGYVSNNDDCRDDNPAVYYGAIEICDGLDNDCDTLPDDADGGVDPYPWESCNQRFSHLIPSFELQGELPGDNAGIAAKVAGDSNLDGSIELLIAAPGNSQSGGDAGKVYLFEYSDLITAAPNTELGEGIHEAVSLAGRRMAFLGESSGDEAGSALASKDVDADGIKDFVIAAPSSDANGVLSGSVYLWLANELPTGQGAYLLSGATQRYDGFSPSDQLGSSVVLLSDLDGDSGAELVFSAPTSNANSASANGVLGRVYGFASSDRSAVPLTWDDTLFGITGVQLGDNLGRSIADCGDLNGDGLSELIVANEHSVGIWSGSTLAAGGSLSGDDAEWTISPGMIPDSVASSGDINLDGHPEILIGSIDMNQTGYGGAYLYDGSDILSSSSSLNQFDAQWTLSSSEANDYSGCAVSPAGDIDQDSRDDLLISSCRSDVLGPNYGLVYLMRGSSLLGSGTVELSAADKIFGDLPLYSTSQFTGTAIAHGDLSNNGVISVLIGSPGITGSLSRGSVFVSVQEEE